MNLILHLCLAQLVYVIGKRLGTERHIEVKLIPDLTNVVFLTGVGAGGIRCSLLHV